ncbi:MAG TPA: Hpt domain-containing protein [Ohtaekwangia sp.]|nr:Hpt domain-containing protein [Ohtaekwangia sp.]
MGITDNKNDNKTTEGESAFQTGYIRQQHLDKISHGDPTVKNILISKSIEAFTENEIKLKKLFDAGDTDGFLRELHKFKGSVGVIEPHQLYPIALELEQQFKQLGPEERAQRVTMILEHLRNVLEELRLILQ